MVFCRPMLAAPPTPAEDFWTFPEGSAAFFAFDPRALGDDAAKDPNRALVEAGLRTLLDHITPVDGGGLPLPSGILNLGTLGASPYRICLMEIAGSPRNGPPSPDRPFGIEKLAAIMEIRVPAAEHDQLIGAIRGALDRDPRRAIPGAETTTTLPGGRKGTQFSRAGDPEWREISWCSTPTGLLVGMGHGSISRWLSTPPYAANQYPEWYAHRVSVTKARGPTNTVLEAMIDASALRRSLPEEFAFGRLGRLAEAWHLPNAREIRHGSPRITSSASR